jgi:hypothetical protein
MVQDLIQKKKEIALLLEKNNNDKICYHNTNVQKT